jgi:hypothetical protein
MKHTLLFPFLKHVIKNKKIQCVFSFLKNTLENGYIKTKFDLQHKILLLLVQFAQIEVTSFNIMASIAIINHCTLNHVGLPISNFFKIIKRHNP